MAEHEQLASPQTTDPTAWRWLVSGLVVAMVISLLAGYVRIPGLDARPGTFLDESLQRLYATNRDILDIVHFAQRATWADVGRWWTGTWIQQNSFYYRPLTSMLMYAEYRLWGYNFSRYCLVSWLVHGISGGLLFLLVYRLAASPGRRRAMAIALLAVVIFNLRRGPVGPGWIPARVVAGEMPYWPAQTDIFSLLVALGSLLSLDWYIYRKHWGWLTAALTLYIAALLFKEMALALVFIAPLVVWYRRRKIPMVVGGIFVGLGAVFLVVRHLALPVAWNPEFRGLGHVLLKIAWYLDEPLLRYVGAGSYWIVPAGLGVVAIAYLAARYCRDVISEVVWTVLGASVWCLFVGQVVAGNFAQATIPEQMAAVGLMILLAGGAVVLIGSRSPLAWTLTGLVVAVHLPILHVSGPHYLYWPAALWGALNAVLLAVAYDQWRDLRAAAIRLTGEEELPHQGI